LREGERVRRGCWGRVQKSSHSITAFNGIIERGRVMSREIRLGKREKGYSSTRLFARELRVFDSLKGIK